MGITFSGTILFSLCSTIYYTIHLAVNFTAIMAPTSIKRRSPSVDAMYTGRARKCAPEIPGCTLSHSLTCTSKNAREREFNFNSRNVKKNRSIARCNMYVGRTRVESTLRADESSSNVYHTYSRAVP